VKHGRIEAFVVGEGDPPGIIHNRMSEKVWRELVYPSRKKTSVDKERTMKHDPWAEFRASPYRLSDPKAPTVIGIKASAFKGAMRSAALDLPGTKKAQIGRLVWVEGDYLPVYGVPQISAMPVRNSDMNHTPDIRFRAIQPEWACRFTVKFVEPIIRAQTVIRLLAAAGLYIGVGDGRNEKGAMHFGGWRMVEPTDAEFARIVKNGGRAPQLAAMDHPEPYDEETADILSWFDEEVERRQVRGQAAPTAPQPASVS
ncbi:MAG: hypothetical protein WB562_05350, partial [Candidatus Sulfotelmatobacter sp.]